MELPTVRSENVRRGPVLSVDYVKIVGAEATAAVVTEPEAEYEETSHVRLVANPDESNPSLRWLYC